MVERYAYFAFGSNMDQERLERRVGPVGVAGPARLRGWRLAFDKQAGCGRASYANIRRHKRRVVFGVVFWLTVEQLGVLDICEGVRVGHYRADVLQVEMLDTGEELDAGCYIATADWDGCRLPPPRDYVATMVRGAIGQGVPRDYVQRHIVPAASVTA